MGARVSPTGRGGRKGRLTGVAAVWRDAGVRRAVACVLASALVSATARAQEPVGAQAAGERVEDPLADSKWRRTARGLQVTTGVLGGVAALSLVGFGVAHAIERKGDPGSYADLKGPPPPAPNNEAAYAATLATAAVLGASTALLFVVGGFYHRHLERGFRAELPGLRSDLKWRHTDRDLSIVMWGAAGVSALSGAGAMYLLHDPGDDPVNIIGGGALAVIGVGSFAGLVAFAAARARHRKKIDRWPRLAAGGLVIEF
jgi:hypothetical protein